MMKHEFEERIGQEVPEEDYEIIDQVYQFYPGIKDVNGKEQVVWLWKNFGIRIFKDMKRRADEFASLDAKIQFYNQEAEKARQSMIKL